MQTNYRNLLIILVLATGFALLLIWKPWQRNEVIPPTIYERLPEAEIVGVSDVLDLSASMSKTLFYYKLPFRDLLTPEFILSQGKNYGVDVQSPVFFFMNHQELRPVDWGLMASVRDSSKVHEGIDQLRKFMEVKTIEIHKQFVYNSPEHRFFITYGDDWMLFYQGDDFVRVLEDVLFAKHNGISSRWRTIINDFDQLHYGMAANIVSDELFSFGISSANITVSNDSSSIYLNTNITQFDSLPFQVKSSGPAFYPQEFTRNIANLHLDIDELRGNTKNPLYQEMDKLSGKISFPLDLFLNAWEGDVAFRQGGFEKIRERYIESELDENFNVTEVVKYRTVKVSGFSLYLSMNEHGSAFIDQLSSKGILSKSDGKHRLLFSPPLNMNTSDTSVVFHTSRYEPEVLKDSLNAVTWSVDKTPLKFYIDSTSVRTLFGRIQIPLQKIVSDHLPKEEE